MSRTDLAVSCFDDAGSSPRISQVLIKGKNSCRGSPLRRAIVRVLKLNFGDCYFRCIETPFRENRFVLISFKAVCDNLAYKIWSMLHDPSAKDNFPPVVPFSGCRVFSCSQCLNSFFQLAFLLPKLVQSQLIHVGSLTVRCGVVILFSCDHCFVYLSYLFEAGGRVGDYNRTQDVTARKAMPYGETVRHARLQVS